MNDFDSNNEIIEIGNDSENSTINDLDEFKVITEPSKNNKLKKEKKVKVKFWNSLTKKKKILIIVISLLIVLLVGLGLIYFLKPKNNKNKTPEKESIVIEKDNYKYKDGNLIFLDKSDKEIGLYECNNKDIDKCLVAKILYNDDNFERIKRVYEDGKELERSSNIYFDKYVFVSDGNELFLYDIIAKEKKLNVKSFKTYNTEKDLVVIEDENNKFGVIEITNDGYEYIIRPSYDYLGIVNPTLKYLVAKDKDDFYVINIDGKKLSKNIGFTIMSVNDKFIVAVNGEKYNLYDYDYNELLNNYDYISLHDDVIALVKNNRLYLRNSNLSKLTEDGIRLENKNFVKEYVYDNDNKLKETKQSYEINIKDNNVMVTIDDTIKNINVLEGKVNENYDYLNYFDGKLYFYSDEDKDELIGTYTCTNKNVVNNDTIKYQNCRLYENEKGTSGIYNNDYVIVYDNNIESDIRYNLYSLKSNKNKGVYSDIEFTTPEEINEKIKNIYTNSSYLIAKSGNGENKGNFGIIEINDDKAFGKVEFKYESIKNINNYYLFKNIDKTLSIYNKNFNLISNIFNYIEAFDNYYVGIVNNKLNIYSYISKEKILEKDLDVQDNKFKVDFTNGFTITIGESTYKYDKNGKAIVDNKPEETSEEVNNEE